MVRSSYFAMYFTRLISLITFRVCAVAFILAFTQGCVKETKVIESREIPVEKKADPNIEDGFALANQKSSTLEIKKSAFGKVYILIPNARMPGRAPQWKYFKPSLVSFEKSGSELGLFRQDQKTIYNDIKSEVLLQTFKILRESNDGVVIDFSKGFKSIPLSEFYDIFMTSKDFSKENEKLLSGDQDGLNIKDSFLKTATLTPERLHIEQTMRFSTLKLSETATLNSIENTAAFHIDLKPYLPSGKFKMTKFDRKQRMGAFTNLILEEGKDLPQLNAMKWDLDPEKGPIHLVIPKNIPSKIINAVVEAGEYWNRTFKRKVFVAKFDGDSDAPPQDRAVMIRWIQWDSAGFAYAGMQSDPLTGEVLSGQVFLTSSWLKNAEGQGSNLADLDFKNPEVSAFKSPGNLCFFEQHMLAPFGTEAGLSPSQVDTVANDTIRLVVAHELGHALGMRHNFAGSANHEGTDAELMESLLSYAQKLQTPKVAGSSTVMDYTSSLITAVNGASIKEKSLPYDVAFGNWIYNEKEIEIPRYQYCSDEHLFAAAVAKRAVYGCARFDQFNNPILGALFSERMRLFNIAREALSFDFLLLKIGEESVIEPSYLAYGSFVNFRPNVQELAPFLYASSESSSRNRFISTKNAVDGFWEQSFGADSDLSTVMKQDFKAIGGFTKLWQWLKPKSDDEQFFQNQVVQLFANLDPNVAGQFSLEKLKQYKEAYIKAAVKADLEFKLLMITEFAPKKNSLYTVYDQKGEVISSSQFQFRSELSFDFDAAKSLIKNFRPILFSRKPTTTVIAAGKDVSVNLIKLSDETRSIRNDALKFLQASYWSIPIAQTILDEEIRITIEAILQNTTAILSAAEIKVEGSTYQDYITAIDKILPAQLLGLELKQLKAELQDLKTIEEQTAEEKKPKK